MTTRIYYPRKQRTRPADLLAGKGSVAGKVRETRQKLESGESTHPVVGGENSPDQVLNRGYFKHD